MNSTVIKRPQAIIDLVEIAAYISEDSIDAGLRFINAAEYSFDFLTKSPEMGRCCNFSSSVAQGVRIWHVKGFEKYLIFYKPIENELEIIRVLHGARDIEAVFTED